MTFFSVGLARGSPVARAVGHSPRPDGERGGTVQSLRRAPVFSNTRALGVGLRRAFFDADPARQTGPYAHRQGDRARCAARGRQSKRQPVGSILWTGWGEALIAGRSRFDFGVSAHAHHGLKPADQRLSFFMICVGMCRMISTTYRKKQ